MEFTVRRAVRADIPQLIDMLTEIGRYHFNGRPDIFRDCALKFDDEKILALMNSPDSPVFVAACGDTVAGYAFCRTKSVSNHPAMADRKYFYIDDFFVCAEYRRQHIGRLLFNAVRLYAAESGFASAELNVWAFNSGAVSFYESLGMSPQRMEMEMPLPSVRQLTENELPAALDVIHRAFATVAGEFGLTRENCPAHTSFMPEERLRTQFNDGRYMFGVYEGGVLAGCASLSDGGGGAYELHNLAVAPEYRRRGYGELLLRHAKNRLRDLGGRKITVGIIDGSDLLREWYLKNGFIHTGTENFAHLPFTVGYMEWRNENADT